MHDTIADGYVAAAKIRPPLLLQLRHQLEPDLAVRLVGLVELTDDGSQRLNKVGAADDPDQPAVLDHGNALDALAFEQRGYLGKRCVLGDRDYPRRHDFADFFAMRLGEIGGERARAG